MKGLPEGSVDRIQKELLGVCHLLEPLYLPVVEPVEYQGKTLLIVWAPGGCERPYSCPERILKKGKSPRAYYVRKMASTVKASRLVEKELFELAGDVPFDDRPNMQADVADLKAWMPEAKCFSRVNLYYMVRFFNLYAPAKIV